MIDVDNRTHGDYDISKLEAIAPTLSLCDIELILVDDFQMQIINKEFRNIDATTDVLSFPSDPFPHAPLGSIVINIDKVSRLSAELGHTQEDEISLLFIHAMLHLLGMDHEVDKGEMRQKEEELVAALGLPNSLIVRTMNK